VTAIVWPAAKLGMPWRAEPNLSRRLRRVAAEVLLAVGRLGLTVLIGVADRLGRHSCSRGGAGGRGPRPPSSAQPSISKTKVRHQAYINGAVWLAKFADFADPKSYAHVYPSRFVAAKEN
jgi:hypothetical protein